MANLAPSWRPKRLQNRGPNPKKSMLKNNTFSASILEGFGPRFGRVFGRFFAPKIHAESDFKKSVRQAKNIVKTNRKSMSALLRQSLFRAKIDEKSHVFWDIDFGWILGGFWEGFGEAKILDFRTFFDVFSKHFFNIFLEGQKIEKKRPTEEHRTHFGTGLRNERPLGERKREGGQA